MSIAECDPQTNKKIPQNLFALAKPIAEVRIDQNERNLYTSFLFYFKPIAILCIYFLLPQLILSCFCRALIFQPGDVKMEKLSGLNI